MDQNDIMEHPNHSSQLLHKQLILKVRHILRVCACNIFPPDGCMQPQPLPALPSFVKRKPLNSGYFFSFHISNESAAFLTSELKCSPHPHWDKFNIIQDAAQHYQTAKGLVTKVWFLPSTPVINHQKSKIDSESDSQNTPSKSVNQNIDIPSEISPDVKKVNQGHHILQSKHLRHASYSVSPERESKFSRTHHKTNSLDPSSVQPPEVAVPPPKPKGCSSDVPPVLLFSWSVHLSGLVPVGKNLLVAAQHLAPNTLVFQLYGDMLYTAPDSIIEAISSLNPSVRELHYDVQMPLSQTKRSYSPNALTRLHQTERDVSIIRKKGEFSHDRLEFLAKMTGDSNHGHLRKKIAAAKARLHVTRQMMEREKNALGEMKGKVARFDEENQEKVMRIMSMAQNLSRDKNHLKSVCRNTMKQMKQLEKIRAQLALRRSHLVKDLSFIYPIVQIGLRAEYSICDLWIPDAQLHSDNSLQTPNFQLNRSPKTSTAKGTPTNVRDGAGLESNARFSINPAFHPFPQTLSTGLPHTPSGLSGGLGMVTHLLCLVSGLLQVPLRYPMKSLGSFSSVKDIATTQLPNDNREFPLYTRGKEREKLHFKYAVFLLNKNIAQLHHYVGLPKPSDPACTLPNLYALLMHLTRDDHSLSDELPDLKCDLLVTSFCDLYNDVSNSSLNVDNLDATFSSPSISPTHYSKDDRGIRLHSYVSDQSNSDVKLSSSAPYEEKDVWRQRANHNLLAHHSALSCSLDKGLDTINDFIGDTSTNENQASTSVNKNTGSLTDLCKEKSLMVVADSIDFSDQNLASCVNDSDTTSFLRSWQESDGNVLQSDGFSSVNSLEGLEEIGVEVTENFRPNEDDITSPSEAKDSGSKDSKKVKGKSRNFWPFSRSNTNESSKESECLADESSLTVNSTLPTVKDASTPTTSLGSPVTPLVPSDSVPSEVSTKKPNLETEELLKQSLAALSHEVDFSKLSDLTSVTDRTEKLASRTFSFKMGGK